MLAWQDPSRWSPQAVHDTVAAIAHRPEFARGIRESLLSRVLMWIGLWLREFLAFFRDREGARWLLWALVALLVVLVAARVLVGIREAERRRRGVASAPSTVADPWGTAARLAAGGSYTEAAHALYAAVLVACASAGGVRLHPSKTTGDYARELRRRRSGRAEPFERFRERYDRVIYGEQSCDADDYAVLLAAAAPLVSTIERRAA